MRFLLIILLIPILLGSCNTIPIEENAISDTEVVPSITVEPAPLIIETLVETPVIYSEYEYFIHEEIAGSKENAQSIIEALEEFVRLEQRYPEDLMDLVPTYLQELPQTISYLPFQYQLSDPDGYILSFKITRLGDRWYCGYLEQRALWDCSGDGSVNRDPTNSLDIEGLYRVQNLVGYMNYDTSLATIYNTIVIYRSEEQNWLDPLTIQEAQMMSGFYDIGYHYVIGEDGTLYEGRDLNCRGNHGFPNYGRIGIFLAGEMTKEQLESTTTLVKYLDYQYKLDYLYGDYDAPGVYLERVPSDTEIEKINELREIILQS